MATAPSTRQHTWWWIAGAAIVLATILAVWFGLSATRGLSWQNTGYAVQDDRSVSVTFDITGQDGRPAVCDLHALDLQRTQVGVSTVRLPASDYDTTRYTRTVRTVTRPAMGEVVECRRTNDNSAATN